MITIPGLAGLILSTGACSPGVAGVVVEGPVLGQEREAKLVALTDRTVRAVRLQTRVACRSRRGRSRYDPLADENGVAAIDSSEMPAGYATPCRLGCPQGAARGPAARAQEGCDEIRL